MASAAPHPFISGTKVHGIRREAVVPEKGAESHKAEDDVETDSYALAPKRKALYAASAALAFALLGGASYAAMTYGQVPTPGNAKAEGVQRVALEPANIVGNQIPDDYPAIYPGEQIVSYHLAPLPGEVTTEETDEEGCEWLRVSGKTEGLMVYPLLSDNGQHVCSDPSLALQPEKARMVKSALPSVAGSSIKVIEIKDAETGSLLMANGAPVNNATPFLPQLANADQARNAIRTQVAQEMSANATASVTRLPSQKASTRPAQISTASDSPAMPVANRRSPQQEQAEGPRAERAPLEPIRRKPAYVPPEDDVLVSISNSSKNANEELVPIGSEQGNLRGIRPGDPPRLPGQRQADSPGGNPLEGYASISGN